MGDQIRSAMQVTLEAGSIGPRYMLPASNDDQLAEMLNLDKEQGLSEPAKVCAEVELEWMWKWKSNLPDELVGINNRDLHQFVTNLEIALWLAPKVQKDWLVVSESGVHSPDDVTGPQDRGIGALFDWRALHEGQ